ncbi:MAG: RHS repeat-associated core domain-containing protein [Myxococcales bacterium]
MNPHAPNCGVQGADCGTCPACVPDCQGHNCGSDGCGGTCGTPTENQICLGGQLVDAYDPTQDHSSGFPTAIPVNFEPPAEEAGALDSSFRISDRGTAAYTIPLQLPPGRHGLVPNLSLTYESSRSTGMVGLGWGIGGFSKIERCNRTLAVHGVAAPVQLVPEDALCLDGVVLVESAGGGLKPAPTHDTELERFQVIRASGEEYRDGAYVGPSSFRVWTKEGHILTYGAVDVYNTLAVGASYTRTDAIVDTNNVHRAWHLSQIEDHAGNFASFVYERTTELRYPRAGDAVYEHTTEIVPLRIGYGLKQDPVSPGSSPYLAQTATVYFSYVANPKPTHHYVAGHLTYQTKLLSRIDTYAFGSAGASKHAVATYKLDYTAPDDLGPRLQSVTQCSQGAGTSGATVERCLPPTKMEYTTFEGYQKIDFDGNGIELGTCLASDPDGDGREEAACAKHRVIFDDAAGTINVIDPGEFRSGGGSIGNLVMDVNRDGLDDNVSCWDHLIYITKRSGNGLRSEAVPLFFEGDPINPGNFHGPPDLCRLGDVDGDGLNDLIIMGARTIAWKRQEKDGLGPQQILIQRDKIDLQYSERILSFDVDGDGKTNFFLIEPGTLAIVPITNNNKLPIDSPYYWPVGPKTLDVNGDGLLDLLVTSHEDGPTLLVNTGRGYFHSKPFRVPENCQGAALLLGVIVLDVDHDGRDDVVPAKQSDACPTGLMRATRNAELTWDASAPRQFDGGSALRTLDLNGDGVEDVLGFGVAWVSKSTNPGLLRTVTNGRGERITVEYKPYVDWPAWDAPDGFVKMNTYRRDVSSAALDGSRDLKRVTPLVSSYRSDQTNYKTGGLAIAGSSHRLHYVTARAGLNGRGWYGFAEKWDALLDPDGNMVSDARTYFHNDEYWRAGLVASTELTTGRLPSGYPQVIATTNHWQELTSALSGRPYPWLRSQVTIEKEINEYRRTDREWVPDDYGNSMLASTKIAVGGTERTSTAIETSYAIDPSRWLISLPEFVRTTDAHGNDSEYRETKYTYTPDGLVDTAIREPNRPALKLTTTYQRAPVSRNVEKVTSVDAEGHSRSERIVYDQRDWFPIAYENANAEVTELQYDERNGRLLTTKDANGVVVQWGYDPFGRIEVVKTPTQQLQRSYARFDSFIGNPITGSLWGAESQQETISPSGRTTQSTLDGYGRVVRTATTGLNGKLVFEETLRDWAGRVLMQTQPHVTHSVSQGAYQYPRDILGRVSSQITPDGRETQFAYYNAGNAVEQGIISDSHVFATMQLDPNGLATYRMADERNLPSQVVQYDVTSGAAPIDAISAGIASVSTYEFGAFGVPRRVKDADGEETLLQTDARGRRYEIASDSIGSTQTTYNAFDEVVEETDANGQKLCFSYDVLSRPTAMRRAGANGLCEPTGEIVSSWQYGTNLGEIGKLVSSYRQSSAGATLGTVETYRYEVEVPGVAYAGRLKSIEQFVPGLSDSLVTSYDYDGPHVSDVHYPSAADVPFSVHYTWDTYGNLTSIDDSSVPGTQSTNYWKFISDHEGVRIASESMNNLIATEYSYNQLGTSCGADAGSCMPGSLRTLRTHRIDSPVQGLQHFEYTYDQSEYLRQIESLDSTGLVTDRSKYVNDVFGQLVHETIGISASTWNEISYAYSLGGDLASVETTAAGGSSTIQSYSYAPARPRLVQTFDGASQATTYGYDGKGRQIARNGHHVAATSQVIDYNDLDLPERLTVGGSEVHRFEYAASGRRTVKRSPETTTIYAGDHYRCTGVTQPTSGSVACSEHFYSVFFGDRLIAEVTKDEFGNEEKRRHVHGDHLGSPSLMTDETGVVTEKRKFSSFGNPNAPFADDTLRTGFTGHEHDSELGLVNMRGRMYDPKLKRFLTPDPFITEPFTPRGLNRFAYVQNSPLNFVDPSGFDGEPNRSGMQGGPDGMQQFQGQSGSTNNRSMDQGGGPGNAQAPSGWYASGNGYGGYFTDADELMAPSSYEDSGKPYDGAPMYYSHGANGPICALPGGPPPGPSGDSMYGGGGSGGGSQQSGGATSGTSGPSTDVGKHTQRDGAHPQIRTPGDLALLTATELLKEGVCNIFGCGAAGASFAEGGEEQMSQVKKILQSVLFFGSAGLGSVIGKIAAQGATASWRSVKAWGHTFGQHGAGAKITNALRGRAAGTGTPQGQWLNNEAAAEFLSGQARGIQGAASARIPAGLGQVIMPDGTIIAATHATIIPNPAGGLRTAFPTL